MNAIQYTVRDVPYELDQALIKLAELNNISKNKLILSELAKSLRIKISRPKSILDDLDWLVGSNTIDDATQATWDQDDKVQKTLTQESYKNHAV
jgi:hypothetical protein